MKRIVASLIFAIVMIVTVCAIALPASAEVNENRGHWVEQQVTPTDYIEYTEYSWVNVEPGVVENSYSEILFSSIDHTMTFGVYGIRDYSFSAFNFRFVFSYNVVPERIEIYTNDIIIFRWSYADPDYFYIFDPDNGDVVYRFNHSAGEVNMVKFWNHIDDIDSVTGTMSDFYAAFGDLRMWFFPSYLQGLEAGRSQGYDEGRQIGFDDGFSVGYGQGYNQGIGADLEVIKDEYYNDGYNTALKDIDSGQFGENLIGQTLTAPLKALNQFVLYETEIGSVTYQVTLGGVLFGVVGILVFVGFLKMFAGG